jgi:hypothetical protein
VINRLIVPLGRRLNLLKVVSALIFYQLDFPYDLTLENPFSLGQIFLQLLALISDIFPIIPQFVFDLFIPFLNDASEVLVRFTGLLPDLLQVLLVAHPYLIEDMVYMSPIMIYVMLDFNQIVLQIVKLLLRVVFNCIQLSLHFSNLRERDVDPLNLIVYLGGVRGHKIR